MPTVIILIVHMYLMYKFHILYSQKLLLYYSKHTETYGKASLISFSPLVLHIGTTWFAYSICSFCMFIPSQQVCQGRLLHVFVVEPSEGVLLNLVFREGKCSRSGDGFTYWAYPQLKIPIPANRAVCGWISWFYSSCDCIFLHVIDVLPQVLHAFVYSFASLGSD